MWVKIKEYCLEWHDCFNCDPEKVKLDFVGMKLPSILLATPFTIQTLLELKLPNLAADYPL